MNIKVKTLSDHARINQLRYATSGSACFDIATTSDAIDIAPGSSAVLKTDLAFEIPQGYVMMVYSRSGHGFKNGVRLANGTGVVDSDYRGELMIKLHNDGDSVFGIRPGDRVAQAMILPVQQVGFELVNDLGNTRRGAGGFGSTGT